jgi:hypothetical protein
LPAAGVNPVEFKTFLAVFVNVVAALIADATVLAADVTADIALPIKLVGILYQIPKMANSLLFFGM